MRYSNATGEVVWESQAWDSIRSDSHSLSFRVGSDAVWMQGSPARVIGDGCAVFGSGASSALDLVGCVDRMRQFLIGVLARELGVVVDLPGARYWLISRVDVTGNLLLPDLAAVRSALTVLRGCEGGRYRVSQQAGDSVYWSHRSRRKSGKAYAKGPHLEYLQRRRAYEGRRYNATELALASRLLRLELKLGAQFWREQVGKHWSLVTPAELREQWEEYFGRMIGGAEVTEASIKERVHALAKTDGQARSALGTWALIQGHGWEAARELVSRPTWYRHLKLLREAGLSDADLSAGQVVFLRRRVIEYREVASWPELRAAA
jgi:II/X family phage/plasmid replication protein